MPLELHDIQGLVLSAYPYLPWARYVLLRIDDVPTARQWLGDLAAAVTTAEDPKDSTACNVALSFAGMEQLGLAPDALATLPRPLQQGMNSEYRSRILGDSGVGAPPLWRWGGHQSEPEVLLAVFAAEPAGLVQPAAVAAGLSVLTSIDSLLLPYSLEHFGFTDGVSQPLLGGTRRAAAAAPEEVIAPGEFVLGYPDESGRRSEGPSVAADHSSAALPLAPDGSGRRDLGRNGSYLVVRQLAQDVAAFRRFVAGDDRLAAEMVGRWPNGAPLALAPDRQDERLSGVNDFGYEGDKYGLRCPLGAHIRRANPRNSTPKTDARSEETARRSSNRHRLLRRGRPYGPADPAVDDERGLMFLALNADVERQFEFVQHTWLNNPTFAGLTGEVDPVTGDQPPGGGTFTEPALPVRRRHSGMSSFVTTRGGAYFFLPGVATLRWLVR